MEGGKLKVFTLEEIIHIFRAGDFVCADELESVGFHLHDENKGSRFLYAGKCQFESMYLSNMSWKGGKSMSGKKNDIQESVFSSFCTNDSPRQPQ